MRLRELMGGHRRFLCPGCDDWHVVNSGWTWNGSTTAPTLDPSVLVTYPAVPDASDEFPEWRTERRCHSFVRDGRIEFLSDSTHALAGQTVELPEESGRSRSGGQAEDPRGQEPGDGQVHGPDGWWGGS